jgi:cell wall-associated NlpC family hydrolase
MTAFLHLLRVAVVGVLALVMSGLALLGTGGTAEARTLRVQDRSVAELAAEALEALAVWQSDESPAHYVAYLEGRDLVARTIAQRLEVDASALEQAWQDVSTVRQIVTLTAVAQVGLKYRYLGKQPSEGFDCSGLTGYAWNSVGVPIGTYSRAQYQGAKRISADQAEAGDLIWYPGHIMMYLGAENVVVHAPYTGRNVEIRQMLPQRVRTARYASPLT